MRTFSSRMFPSTVVVHVGGYSRDTRGGTVPSYNDGGTTLTCYVEAASSRVARDEEIGSPVGRKQWDVFTPSDPGAKVDSHLIWEGRTLSSLGRSQPSDKTVLWKTECEEIA